MPVSIGTSGVSHSVSSVGSYTGGYKNEIEVNVPTVIHSLGSQPFNISVVNIPGLNSDFKSENGQAPT